MSPPSGNQSSGKTTNTLDDRERAKKGRKPLDWKLSGKRQIFLRSTGLNEGPAVMPSSPSTPKGWTSVNRTRPQPHRHSSFESETSINSIKMCATHAGRFVLGYFGFKCKGEGCKKYVCKYCKIKSLVAKGRITRRRCLLTRLVGISIVDDLMYEELEFGLVDL
ncbi:hypothetical protein LTR97_011925 [Elasticomyces elasticus]|uniref:Uncharacterized protein n=1 Tax=Elasticomyces elasticus TaxID=574655 RepID=A0AAN7VXR2_9PEZI|nr:hypothetical protein LTR97_011925 [Elasticomyces elasticus]KAK5717705.1 hypothetical protein LTR15_008544 [Elasticomyces elasticus]